MYAWSRRSTSGARPSTRERRVDARHQPCAAASSYPDVPLICPARKSPRHEPRLERRVELVRRHEVVLDRVAGADQLAPARARGSCARARAARPRAGSSRARSRRSRARRVPRARGRSGASRLVGELHHLVLDRRAVARADARGSCPSRAARGADSSRISACVRSLVRVRWQCDLVERRATRSSARTDAAARRRAAATCAAKSIESRWSRGGVPVLRRDGLEARARPGTR